MRQIGLAELTEGMVVGDNIHSLNGHLLFKRGFRLDAAAIHLLEKAGLPTVPIAAEEPRRVQPALSPLRQESQKLLEQAAHGFARQIATRNLILQPEQVQRAMQTLYEAMAAEEKAASVVAIHRWSERLLQHSVSAALLETILAQELGYSETDCSQATLGMLLHDYGQIFLVRSIFEKQGKLTEEELRIARDHAQVGYEQLMTEGVLPPEAADIVRHHHERLDGSGYPDGLTERQLNPLTRLAAVVEVFDAMTSVRPGKRAGAPEVVLREMMTQIGTRFDKNAILTLARHIVLYPNGASVQLNTGEIGVVIETHPESVLRPVVRLFFDAEGRRIRAYEIDLRKESQRRIVSTGESVMQLKETLEHDARSAVF